MAQARGLAELVSLAAQPTACITAISGTVAGVSVAVISRSSTAHCASFEGDQSAWRDTYALEPSEGLGSTPRIDEAFSQPTGWKVYEVKPKSVGSVYSPYNLLFTALRSLAFNLLPLWHEYFQQVEAAEEEAFRQGLEPLEEWPPLPKDAIAPALHRSVWQAVRDLATLTVRRLYEREAALRCSPHLASKLLKDVRASIIRKRQIPFYVRVFRVTRTYARGNVLGSAADCTVSIVIDSYRVIYKPAKRDPGVRKPRTIAQRFARICAANGLRCTTCLVVAAAGAGIGAWAAKPFKAEGAGALVGASAAEFGFTVFVFAPYVNDWAYGPGPGPVAQRAEDTPSGAQQPAGNGGGGSGGGGDWELPGDLNAAPGG